ncbi:helix-turn-helix domain-containing protein [Paenibacillus sp.]|uniref:helix-turn-helix domain-containing protein n=1 Tax=Paenibacillus sp. TaxID=58172 RepID=UPI002811C2B5|nr:helix-turn-helix domain-containing protein [Paenibacillus sp.]
MSEQKADLILHPVRMRIIQCLIGGAPKSAQQLQELLPDVPQATLYRHLKKLSDANMLAIAEERPNRGTVERWYTLPERAAELTADDLRAASPEDHLAFFMKFASHLIGQYGRYVRKPGLDLLADGVSYRQIALQLSDEEHLRLLASIRELFAEAARNEPSPERRNRVYSVIAFPE